MIIARSDKREGNDHRSTKETTTVPPELIRESASACEESRDHPEGLPDTEEETTSDRMEKFMPKIGRKEKFASNISQGTAEEQKLQWLSREFVQWQGRDG